MGMVFGKIQVETPKHAVVFSGTDYEIRRYPPAVVAEISYSPEDFNGDRDGGFRVLAAYIGALGGNPQNSPSEKIAMTAPVITTAAVGGEKIAMTAPVITAGVGGDTKKIVMAFVLPTKYGTAEEAPRPTDERVVLKEVRERIYAVVRFAGVATEEKVVAMAERLKASLERDGRKVVADGEYLLARYNPPWTLPPLRTNEVFIPVDID